MVARKVQLGARIDGDLYKKLRILAAKEGSRLGPLVEEAIKKLLLTRRRDRRRARAS